MTVNKTLCGKIFVKKKNEILFTNDRAKKESATKSLKIP